MGRAAAVPAWNGPAFWCACLGGVAAGAYALACLAELFGGEADRRASRSGYDLAFPLAAVCGLLLAAGAKPPPPALSASLGVFLALSFGSWVGAVAAEGKAGLALAPAGGLAALAFGAAVCGLLPRGWAGSPWPGAVMLVSSAPAGVSAVVLLDRCRSPGGDDSAVERLGRVNGLAVVAELAALVGLGLSVPGPLGMAFLRWPGMLIPLFVVPVGLVVPLIVGEVKGARGEADVAALVLLGGFVLRVALFGIPDSLPFS